MKSRRLYFIFVLLVNIGLSGFFLSSCNEKSLEGKIVFTQIPKMIKNIDYATGNSWRYLPDSRIVLVNKDGNDGSVKILTDEFFAACSPAISYDAQQMLFAGQKNVEDPWGIWEMNLSDLKFRRITSLKENCIDPAYLPGGRIVFSKMNRDQTGTLGHSLFTCKLDGSETRQITFKPHAYFASTVLQDGRILSISKPLYPESGDGILMVLRPDGTKEELFYSGANATQLTNCGRETIDGKIVLIESDATNKEMGNLIAIDYSSPMNSRIDLSKNLKGSFQSLSPQINGKLLVSYRASEKEAYGIYEFDPGNRSMAKTIYKNQDYSAIGAVPIRKSEKPKNIPSEVNMEVKTGLLLCQDVNFSGMRIEENMPEQSLAVKLEVLGLDTSLALVDIEKDGSVYLKVEADMPFKLQTIDMEGEIVSGPSSWIYLRPNERRGCVGCHQGNEIVPDNRQPLSVLKEPIAISQHTRLMAKTALKTE